MKECVIVHGSDNFIGARLMAALEMENHFVVRAVRAADVASLRICLPGARAIANCVVGSAKHIERSASSLFGLLSALNDTPRVVHLSSMTVYGSATGSIDERCALLADLGPYSEAQRGAEKIAADYSNVVILRSGVEYGPTCLPWSERVAKWLRARRLGDLGESGDGVCNLVYIDDLIFVILAALREGGIEGEIFNVAAADRLTWNDYFIAFALALRAAPVRRISARRLLLETRVAAPVLRLGELVTNAARIDWLQIPPPIPKSLLRLCRQEIVLAAARVEQTLGVRWTPTDQGLAQTAKCY